MKLRNLFSMKLVPVIKIYIAHKHPPSIDVFKAIYYSHKLLEISQTWPNID